MEDLIKKLQEKIGISEKQAKEAVSIIKEQIETGNLDIDWDKIVSGKYEGLLSKVKTVFNEKADEVDGFADKLSNKADSLADEAKAKLRDISLKAADFFDDNKK